MDGGWWTSWACGRGVLVVLVAWASRAWEHRAFCKCIWPYLMMLSLHLLHLCIYRIAQDPLVSWHDQARPRMATGVREKALRGDAPTSSLALERTGDEQEMSYVLSASSQLCRVGKGQGSLRPKLAADKQPTTSLQAFQRHGINLNLRRT